MPDEAERDALLAELVVLLDVIAREVERHDAWFAKRRRMLRGEIPAHLLPHDETMPSTNTQASNQ